MYWTVYYIVTDQLYLAVQTGHTAVKVAVAIVLGIVLCLSCPRDCSGTGGQRDEALRR